MTLGVDAAVGEGVVDFGDVDFGEVILTGDVDTAVLATCGFDWISSGSLELFKVFVETTASSGCGCSATVGSCFGR